MNSQQDWPVTAQCRSSPSFQPDKLQNLNSFAYLLKKQHRNQWNWRYMTEVIKRNKLISNSTMRSGQPQLALKTLELLGPTHPAPGLGEVPQVFCLCQRLLNWRWLIPFSKSRVVLNSLSLPFVQLLYGDLSFNTDFSLIKTDFLRSAFFSFCFSDRNAEAQTIHEPDQVGNSKLLLPNLNVQLFYYFWFKCLLWFKSSTKPVKLSDSANCSQSL